MDNKKRSDSEEIRTRSKPAPTWQRGFLDGKFRHGWERHTACFKLLFCLPFSTRVRCVGACACTNARLKRQQSLLLMVSLHHDADGDPSSKQHGAVMQRRLEQAYGPRGTVITWCSWWSRSHPSAQGCPAPPAWRGAATDPILTGQVQGVNVEDPEAARVRLLDEGEEFLALANSLHPGRTWRQRVGYRGPPATCP